MGKSQAVWSQDSAHGAQVDVFGLVGATNCGAYNLHRQLLRFTALRSIAEKIALLDRRIAFSDIADCIGKARVPCHAPERLLDRASRTCISTLLYRVRSYRDGEVYLQMRSDTVCNGQRSIKSVQVTYK